MIYLRQVAPAGVRTASRGKRHFLHTGLSTCLCLCQSNPPLQIKKKWPPFQHPPTTTCYSLSIWATNGQKLGRRRWIRCTQSTWWKGESFFVKTEMVPGGKYLSRGLFFTYFFFLCCILFVFLDRNKRGEKESEEEKVILSPSNQC